MVIVICNGKGEKHSWQCVADSISNENAPALTHLPRCVFDSRYAQLKSFDEQSQWFLGRLPLWLSHLNTRGHWAQREPVILLADKYSECLTSMTDHVTDKNNFHDNQHTSIGLVYNFAPWYSLLLATWASSRQEEVQVSAGRGEAMSCRKEEYSLTHWSCVTRKCALGSCHTQRGIVGRGPTNPSLGTV